MSHFTTYVITSSYVPRILIPEGSRCLIEQGCYPLVRCTASTGKGPRKGWRTPLNTIICSEQRDEETGYGYFGARYLDHGLTTMWLSVDPLADKYPSISPYAYCAWNRPTGGHEHRLIKSKLVNNPVKLVDLDGRDGDVVVVKKEHTITINMNIYYNENDEYFQRYVSSEFDQIGLARREGFGSKQWTYIDTESQAWTVTFNILFHPLNNDQEVNYVLESDPMANKLCYDHDYKDAGSWNPASRTIKLGYNSWVRTAVKDAGTLSHEIGHALGLQHPRESHRNEDGDFGIMSYSLNRTVWNSEVSAIANKVIIGSSVCTNNVVRLHLYGRSNNNAEIISLQ